MTNNTTSPGNDESSSTPTQTLEPAVIDHASRKHHKFGMSKLNAYAACAGYESQEGTNKAAEDGTRLHEILDKLIVSLGLRSSHRSLVAQLRKELEDGTVLADEDDISLLEFCAREVDKFLPKAVEVHNELRVEILKPNGEPLNFGSLDLLMIFPNNVGLIDDYKFGWVPVPAAKSNLQGKGYALGAFQRFPRLDKIAVRFLQPKLGAVTTATFTRQQIPELYEEIHGVIARAQSGQEVTLRPNPYCDFCANAGTCTALVKSASAVVAKYDNLLLPDVFDGLHITTAEQAVAALYVIDRLDALLSRAGVRDKALEFAKAAGGTLSVPVGDQLVTVSVHERKRSRSANSPALIAETLKDTLEPSQVLGCCDISITKLEEVFAEAYVEKSRKEADAIIAGAENLAPVLRKEAAARAKEARSTKKNAHAVLNDVLRSEGLISAPEGVTEYLKLRVDKPSTIQIENE